MSGYTTVLYCTRPKQKHLDFCSGSPTHKFKLIEIVFQSVPASHRLFPTKKSVHFLYFLSSPLAQSNLISPEFRAHSTRTVR